VLGVSVLRVADGSLSRSVFLSVQFRLAHSPWGRRAVLMMLFTEVGLRIVFELVMQAAERDDDKAD